MYHILRVTSAAVAAITNRIQMPRRQRRSSWHNPNFRVAEEWAVVDNLSRQRRDSVRPQAGKLNDFVLAPRQLRAPQANNALSNRVVRNSGAARPSLAQLHIARTCDENFARVQFNASSQI